jgi:uncharacterized delta-60 repeat protein
MRALLLRVAVGACAAVLIGASASSAAPSDLDRSFGVFGRALPQFTNGFGPVRDLLPLPDGRLVGITGAGVRFGGEFGSVFALTQHGKLDPTFGSGGAASFSAALSSGSGAAQAIVRQPDGGLVVLGGNSFAQPQFALVRYTADGAIDTSFGSGGRVESDSVTPIALAAAPDGSLIVAVAGCAASGSCRSALVRYTAGGVLDRSFGGGGVVRMPFDARASVVVQRAGRITVAGAIAPGKVGIARFGADGSAGPAVSGLLPQGLEPVDFLLASDGKLLVAARDTRSHRTQSWVVRYRADGAVDAGFGVRGAARLRELSVNAMARQRNGKLAVVGAGDLETAFATVRLRADGSRDRGFGRRGRMLTDLDPGSNISQVPFAVAIARDSRIVVAGGTGFPDYQPVIIRYKGGPSRVSGAAAKGRYVVRVQHPAFTHITGKFHRGDVAKVRLEDRHGRTQRYEVCFRPPPLGRGYCTGRRTNSGLVWRRLSQAGNWTIRFRIRATGEVILHTLRVFAPSR